MLNPPVLIAKAPRGREGWSPGVLTSGPIHHLPGGNMWISPLDIGEYWWILVNIGEYQPEIRIITPETFWILQICNHCDLLRRVKNVGNEGMTHSKKTWIMVPFTSIPANHGPARDHFSGHRFLHGNSSYHIPGWMTIYFWSNLKTDRATTVMSQNSGVQLLFYFLRSYTYYI